MLEPYTMSIHINTATAQVNVSRDGRICLGNNALPLYKAPSKLHTLASYRPQRLHDHLLRRLLPEAEIPAVLQPGHALVMRLLHQLRVVQDDLLLAVRQRQSREIACEYGLLNLFRAYIWFGTLGRFRPGRLGYRFSRPPVEVCSLLTL